MSEAIRRVREDATAWRNYMTDIKQKAHGPQAKGARTSSNL